MTSRLIRPLLAAALVFSTLGGAGVVEAQDMDLALWRLRTEDPGADGRFQPNNDDWRRVMTQMSSLLAPPVLTPAGTRGVRGLYIGLESSITNLDASADYWHRAVRGDEPDASRSRFVDGVLALNRANVRKGLPFGFELGTSVGFIANTSYWVLGLEVRWALFEGFREGVGWIPDLAVRGAVQTLVGGNDFNLTVPSVDVILSQPFIIANALEFTPYIAVQASWIFADSELVDLTPAMGAFGPCNPDPRDPREIGVGSPPYCRGDGSDLNNNHVFDSIRAIRWRAFAGVSLRYEWIVLTGAFAFDLVRPGDGDEALPADLDRQWRVDVGLGVTL